MQYNSILNIKVTYAYILKAIKTQLIHLLFIPFHSNVFPLSVYLQVSLMYINALAKLELDYAHLLKHLVKNAKFIKKILNLLSSLNSTQFQFE